MESKPTLSSLCISSFGKYGLQDCTGAEYDDEVLTKDTNGNVNTVDELLSDRFNNQIETPFSWDFYESMNSNFNKMIPNMTVVEHPH